MYEVIGRETVSKYADYKAAIRTLDLDHGLKIECSTEKEAQRIYKCLYAYFRRNSGLSLSRSIEDSILRIWIKEVA